MEDIEPKPEREPSLSERQEAFLMIISAHALTDRDAAAACGLSRWAVINWKRSNPDFVKRYKEARKISVDQIVEEAKRRAMAGSDRLIEFLLCNLAPDQFTNRQRVEHTVDTELATRILEARKRGGA